MPPERECCPRRTPHSVCKGRRVGNGSRHIQSVCFLRPFLARVVRGRVFPLASWGRMRLSARLWFILLVLVRTSEASPFRFLTSNERRDLLPKRGQPGAGHQTAHYSRHPRCGRNDTGRERQTLGSYAATCEAVRRARSSPPRGGPPALAPSSEQLGDDARADGPAALAEGEAPGSRKWTPLHFGAA